MVTTTKSIHIILNQYKKENITEEEAITLIEDIYNKQIYYYPNTTLTYPSYETICSNNMTTTSEK